jgi:hypothetical protein
LIDGKAFQMTKKIRDRAALIELIGGYMAAHSLALAAELTIADYIKDGVRTSADLADATGSHEPSLLRLLRTLVAVGVTTEPEPGRFGLTDVGAQLRSDSPDSLYAFTRFFTNPSLFTAWQQVGHTIKTGESAFDHVHGKNIYAYLAAVLGAHPHLNGVVFDSPSGVAEAGDVLANAGVADRCEVVAGDFFEAVPSDGDLYVIKSVFQDWDDESAKAILRTCRACMPETATLVIVGSVLPDLATTTEKVMFYTDVNMLVTAGGRERTEGQFRELLEESGFTVRSVASGAAGPLSLIETTPASL